MRAILLLLLCALVHGKRKTFYPEEDTTLFSDAKNNGNGGAPVVFVGQTNNGGIRRALLKFDVSSIPEEAEIFSAELTMHVTMHAPTVSTDSVSIHRVLKNWKEDTSLTASKGQGEPASKSATWRFRTNKKWKKAGGDFMKTASDTQSIEGSDQNTVTWKSDKLVNDVKFWINTPNKNFGLLLKSSGGPGSARQYGSSQGSATQRPALIVEYDDDDDETGSCCLKSGMCVLVLEDDCKGAFNGVGTTCIDAKCPVILSPWKDELPIPSVAQPVASGSGGAKYIMTVSKGMHQFHRDLPPSQVFRFNDELPGPTIVTQNNQKVTVVWRNQLLNDDGTPMTTHPLKGGECVHGPNFWGSTPRFVPHVHGGVISSRSDGNPDYAILPGEEDLYVYENKQSAATLWYHDHALGQTRKNVYMGLYGAYLVTSKAEDKLGLPSGEFMVPLVIQDRSFNPDGSLLYPENLFGSYFADYTVVNGKVAPFMKVKRAKYRFRAVNGANSRTYTLSLKGRPMTLIGLDQGLLSKPHEMTEITLAPGERRDFIIDFSVYDKGVNVNMINVANVPFPGGSVTETASKVLKFKVVGSNKVSSPAIPSNLVKFTKLKSKFSVKTRSFTMLQERTTCGFIKWSINGRHWQDIDELPVIDTTEIWEFVNPSGMMHPMHVHLVKFHILSRHKLEIDFATGTVLSVGPAQDPEAHELGWIDTVRVNPDEMIRVIMRFKGYTGKFAYHCHLLEHEDHDMMRQMRVINDKKNCNNNGVCEAEEDCESCPKDCGVASGAKCGNGLCEVGDGETCKTCPFDCARGATFCCGEDTNCDDHRCGPRCKPTQSVMSCCGDSVCEGAETPSSCSVDCSCSSMNQALGCQYV